jgi:hypothetical protein
MFQNRGNIGDRHRAVDFETFLPVEHDQRGGPDAAEISIGCVGRPLR